ncbi:MAG TPA: hypothetical protein VMT86_19365 [Bryobacteraceae bacterium]|nr:hypothetical protein [Bryobacteraceae bacterium]
MLPSRLAAPAIVIVLAISVFDIATGLEHWPFGSYPMYSTVYPQRLSWLRLYGVTAQGEIPLRGDRDFAPFDQARLIMALERIQAAPGAKQNLDDALHNLAALYNRQPEHPPLRALRLYQVAWQLKPGQRGTEPPDQRTLVAEENAP